MKKFLVFLFLMLIGTSVYAQKSYINVYVSDRLASSDYQLIYVTGDRPSGIYSYYDDLDKMTIGRLLNKLSKLGYEVEFVTNNAIAPSLSTSTTYYRAMNYLLSKESSSNQTQIKGDVNIDGEVNIADVNEVISLILGYVREHPEILEQIRK